MKYLLTVLIITSLIGCSNEKEDLKKRAEAYLKEQMKDPSSFQVIKSEMVDTTMMSKYLKDRYDYDTSMISLTKTENDLDILKQNFEKGEEVEKIKYEKILQQKVDLYKNLAIIDLKRINELKNDSIYFITLNFEYRAKNSYGALDKESKNIKYYPNDQSFKIE